MTRTQIYIGDSQKIALESLAKVRGVAMAQSVDDMAGMWSDRTDISDGVSYENSIRDGWNCRSVFAEKSTNYVTSKTKRC